MPGASYRNLLFGFAALAAQVDAFWRLPCASPVVVQRADPIEDPNAVSKHVHTVLGSNAFNFTMNYHDTQAATCSTCKAVEDLSSYWVPSLYYHAENGSFISVEQVGGALIYYLQRSDPNDPNAAEGLIPFPEDFRMVAGTRENRNFTDSPEQRAVSFVCLGTEGPATYELPNRNCPGGLRTQLIMPSCWDGKNLDSPDHKSHMAYPSGIDNGVCPKSHPKRFITMFYEVTWSVDEFKDQWYGDQQPFVFSHGDETGYGYHGDFINGWDIPTLQKAINECNAESGVIEECGAFTLREDDDMKSCKIMPRVNESVKGVLSALPGCNKIQAGPESSDCREAAKIGDPILPFTDMTKKLGWKYVACAEDPAGQSRTLSDLSIDQQDMTVDKCIATCGDKGFEYAGVEYTSQCFCGHGIPKDRLPANGTTGDCSMPCAGNSDQFCGGAARVSIYTKCHDSSYCVN
ncbi:WSC domain-containing protein [Xylaria bambusicola]|uniref:WSC domain-containing protein n=1 Tax=Xylaria bambusicola TaxID=326684 RepID=UPI002007F2F9|nr:WSC domain-containing protein [Xylaria bambusicola]KAI0505997.1 WSC domain-containing protein [Xylaria bambusicola]